jgi:predicted N-acyltransferase
MVIKVFRTIKQIDKNAWNYVTKGPFLSYEWFEFLEETLTDEFIPYYIAYYRKEMLVGALPAFCPTTNENVYEKLILGRFKKFTDKFNLPTRKALLCFSPYSSGKYILTDAKLDFRVLIELINTLEKLALENRMSEIVFLFLKENESEIINYLEGNGYIKVFLNSVGILKNRFTSFEDYLRTLPKSRRKQARRDIRKFNKSGNTIELVKDPLTEIKKIYILKENIIKKYPSSPDKMDLHTLETSFKKMQKYMTTFLVKSEDEIIGSLTLLEKDHIINTYALGLDYLKTNESRAYFYLLYYNTIMKMIERNVPYINFNQAAYKVKEVRGCELTKQYMLIKILKGNFWKKRWLHLVDYQYRHKFLKEYNKK